MNKLNLGCGTRPREGYVNLDSFKFEGVNVIHDLDKYPWPFKGNAFDEVYSAHVLEHLADLVRAMEEIWRISKLGAVIKIEVPYYTGSNSFSDPTHKRFFTYKTFDFFEKDKMRNYFDKSNKHGFKILSKKIIFSDNLLLKWLNFLPNLSPMIYERFFSFILPSQSLIVKLRAIK